MALSGKLETEVEIKSPADKFFSIIRSKGHEVPKISSDKIHTAEVHEGDWESHGSIRFWKYTIGGKVETIKEKIEVDDVNKSITLTALEGHCLEQYKKYKAIFAVTPKGDGSSVKITVEYEKLKEDIPPPDGYLEFLVHVTKDIDSHLVKGE